MAYGDARRLSGRGIPDVVRRASVPIRECTSDNRVRVRREAVRRQTHTPSYVVGCLAVTVRPHGLDGLWANRERPPISACLDRHRGGTACARPCHPPRRGRSRSISPWREGKGRCPGKVRRTWRRTPGPRSWPTSRDPEAGLVRRYAALPAALDSLPARIFGPGATPGGRGPACENTPASEPAPGPRTGGSLPSTSVLPSAAPATGWRRTQLQATARDR